MLNLWLPDAGLGIILPALFLVVGGFYVGSLLGCWLLLQLREHPAADTTTMILVGLIPGIAVLSFAGSGLFPVRSKVVFGALYLLAPGLARWAALQSHSR